MEFNSSKATHPSAVQLKQGSLHGYQPSGPAFDQRPSQDEEKAAAKVLEEEYDKAKAWIVAHWSTFFECFVPDLIEREELGGTELREALQISKIIGGAAA